MKSTALPALVLTLAATPLVAQSSIRSWGQMRFDTEAAEGGIVQIVAEEYATAILRNDGRIFLNGGSSNVAMTPAPALPPGRRYTDVSICDYGVVAVVDDGTIVSWCTINNSPPIPWLPPAPPAPSGTKYIDVEAGNLFAVARRSDGAVVAWGNNQVGQCNVPNIAPEYRQSRYPSMLPLAVLPLTTDRSFSGVT